MKFYYVSWKGVGDGFASFRSHVLTCNSIAQAKRLAKQIDENATRITVRELDG